MSTDFDFAGEFFADANFVETAALTYSGKTYDIIRHAETWEVDRASGGANQVRVLPVDVLVSAFTAGHPAVRATVTLDGVTRRIVDRRTSANRETYRLMLGPEFEGA